MSDLVPDPTKQDHRPAVYEDSNGEIVYRASAIGFCTKMLIALRQGYRSKAVPQKMRDKMDESSALEDEAIDRYIADHHLDITEVDRQVPPIKLKVKDGVFIRGKPDTAVKTKDGLSGLIEVKNLGDSLYKSNCVSIQHKYKAQVTTYMVGYDFAILVLRNKDTGEMFYKRYPTTPLDLGSLFRKVLHIESQAETLELPEKCDPVQYPCPVFYLHEREPIEPWEDEALQRDFEELSRAYDVVRKTESEAKQQKKALQQELIAFRARHPEIVDKDGTVNSSRARLHEGESGRTDYNNQKLMHFLAKHDRSPEDFKERKTFPVWYVTWRG